MIATFKFAFAQAVAENSNTPSGKLAPTGGFDPVGPTLAEPGTSTQPGGVPLICTSASPPAGSGKVSKGQALAEANTGVDATLLPTALVATTLKSCATPFVNPLTVQAVAGAAAVQVTDAPPAAGR